MANVSPVALVTQFFARLRFPQLFTVAAILFFIDLVFPDFVPFIDEILLAAATILLGSWQQERHTEERPPEKDVTPRDERT